jgi:hypothetical protein
VVTRAGAGSRFGADSNRLPKELAAAGITTVAASERYLREVFGVGERHRAVVWMLTLFKVHRSSRNGPHSSRVQRTGA